MLASSANVGYRRRYTQHAALMLVHQKPTTSSVSLQQLLHCLILNTWHAGIISQCRLSPPLYAACSADAGALKSNHLICQPAAAAPLFHPIHGHTTNCLNTCT
jgi:hypothetical protein